MAIFALAWCIIFKVIMNFDFFFFSRCTYVFCNDSYLDDYYLYYNEHTNNYLIINIQIIMLISYYIAV